ncbi:hypothetical protein [Burkholderia ubonensis]|uniref:hypothetical protein n=1 Tax=Burkholderia ubonensis TaxID=101571 RepID=UPI0007541D20|nr:hypothetical protein [Burkholderia ubonensis]KVP39726.1 hypothetical protein WJ87_05955 [Burkholderia ubonensis]
MYRVWSKGEYATFCLDEWSWESLGNPTRSVYGGELLVHSSFGQFCHTWNSCAVPFKQFLLNIGFDSFMTKCLGEDYLVFDGSASVEQVKQAIQQQRREEGLSAEEARELWDELETVSETAESSEEGFHIALAEVCREDTIGSSSEYAVRVPSSQAEGFWRELWPEFKAMLEAALKEPAITVANAA